MQACQEAGVAQAGIARRFASDAAAAGYPVPHMGAALIDKYAAGLKHLGLL